jgi:hypothetical protein
MSEEYYNGAEQDPRNRIKRDAEELFRGFHDAVNKAREHAGDPSASMRDEHKNTIDREFLFLLKRISEYKDQHNGEDPIVAAVITELLGFLLDLSQDVRLPLLSR